MGSDADAAAGAAPREREAEIEKAMRARVPDFKKQADSLTLEGVRRALEKDLGLEIYSLDAHKKFIKQCVDKVFAESDDENTNDNASEDAEAKDDHLSKEGSDDAKPTPASNKTTSGAADAQVVKSSETGKDPEEEKDKISSSDISEDMIKEAIEKRASYFRKNSETLTLQGVRRTLEEDLKLQKKALDVYKNFITTQLDKVLQEPANGTKKKGKKGPPMDTDHKASKGSKRARADSDSSELENSQSEMEDSDEDTRPRKKRAEKAKVVKKQKKVPDEKKLSTPKAQKVAKKNSDRSGDEEGGSSAEEDNSHSSSEEDNKRKRQQAPAPAYGKHVEHLKSIIKSCGMTIPPTVYRKAKQAPEHKREACLIKELEDMLEKEGLSKNPSEKEIKAVKKRKERAKELEGIDTSNIITSSRRRSTSSFIPLPPPPKIEDDSDDDEDDVAKDDDEDDEENLEDEDAGDNDDAEAGDGSADDAAKDSD